VKKQLFGAVGAVWFVGVWWLSTPVAGQVPAKPAAAQERPGAASSYVPARTPDGQPNLSGMWLPGSGAMMEAPSGEPWKPPPGYNGGNNAAYTFFPPVDASTRPAAGPRERRPMIFDPPDGKIPLQDWAAAKRTEIVANQEKVDLLDPRVRCLQSGVPRANLPVFYNSYQFLQKPGYVVLLYEWNHMSRIIPLDGRPHLPQGIRLANGDSRGRWEGNTLIVDVTNFNDDTWVVGHGAPPEGAPASAISTGHGIIHSDALHVVERFTLVAADTIRYEATIDDPKVFTRPWSFAFDAFKRAPGDHILYEYACHEGNGKNILHLTGVDIDK
jgi:hypothetical protein